MNKYSHSFRRVGFALSASTEPATNLCGTAEPCFAAAKASPLVAQLYLCNPAAAAMAAKCFNYQKSVFQGGDFLQHLWCMVCIRASNTNGGVHAAYLSWEGSHEKAATWFCTLLQGKAGHILNLHPTLSPVTVVVIDLLLCGLRLVHLGTFGYMVCL